MFFSSATSSCYACFVCVLLISLCSSACVTTTNPNGSSCNICVDNANQFIKCSITICTNNNMCRDTLLTSNDCANNCCADDNGSSFCIKKVSIGLAIAIIVLAITIGIPTIIFLIIIFRSCLCKTRGTLPPTQIIKLSDYKCD